MLDLAMITLFIVLTLIAVGLIQGSEKVISEGSENK